MIIFSFGFVGHKYLTEHTWNVILVIPNHETDSKGTERGLIKDAGLTVEEFNKLLKK